MKASDGVALAVYGASLKALGVGDVSLPIAFIGLGTGIWIVYGAESLLTSYLEEDR